VKKGFDVEIHDFVEINFSGFRKIIDSIDGVPVYFPYAAREFRFVLRCARGCNILSGQQALNYVRSRKYEQNINAAGCKTTRTTTDAPNASATSSSSQWTGVIAKAAAIRPRCATC